MTIRDHRLASLCLASLSFALAFAAIPALALEVVGSAPDLVSGMVMSVDPHVVPETGVIESDVLVLDSQPGGVIALTRFTMQGGEVGDIGMWSEQFTDLSIGDLLIVGVAERDGESAAVMAPIVGTGSSAATVLGLASGVANIAAGYIWDGIHWGESSLPVPYYVNPSGLPAGAAPAISGAAQTWENDSGSYMDYTYAGSTGVSSVANDGVNLIGAGALGSSTTIAQCTYWYSVPSEELVGFDIIYNTGAFAFATNGASTAYDVQGIGTHELGHTLSLRDLYDAENSGEVMYGYGLRGDLTQRVLGGGDIRGIRAIYRGSVLSGYVTNSVGTPLGGVSVKVDNVASGTTDGSGYYRISGIVSGTHNVTYSLAGYASRTYSVNLASEAAQSAILTAIPVAVADSASVAEDAILTTAAPGVLINDTDADSGSLSAVVYTAPAHGTLSLVASGAYTYQPAPNWSGTDSFTYRAYDGTAYSAPALVTIIVTPVNDAPVAAADSDVGARDTTLTVVAPGALSNDTDVDGDVLSAVLSAGPSQGTLALASNGSYTYTPTANWSGTDSFTYRAYDGAAYSAVVTVSITVNEVNHVAVAVADSATLVQDSVLSVAAPGVLANDSDADGGRLGAVLIAGPSHGALALARDGSYTYRPDVGWSGTDSFTYHTYDGMAYSAPATVTITATVFVAPAKVVPVQAGVSVSTPRRVKRSKSFYITGRVTPAHTAGTQAALRIERYYKRRWRVVKRVTVTLPPGVDTYRYRAKLSTKGSWRVVATHSGDNVLDTGTAVATRKFRVR